MNCCVLVPNVGLMLCCFRVLMCCGTELIWERGLYAFLGCCDGRIFGDRASISLSVFAGLGFGINVQDGGVG